MWVTTLNSCFYSVRLVVTATDRGSPRLAGSATLMVIIVDLNDNSPTIPLPREIRVPESKSALSFRPGGSLGGPVYHREGWLCCVCSIRPFSDHIVCM